MWQCLCVVIASDRVATLFVVKEEKMIFDIFYLLLE